MSKFDSSKKSLTGKSVTQVKQKPSYRCCKVLYIDAVPGSNLTRILKRILETAVWVKSRKMVVLGNLETVKLYMSVCIFYGTVVTEFKGDLDTLMRTFFVPTKTLLVFEGSWGILQTVKE